jgi:methionine-gamma-lyase
MHGYGGMLAFELAGGFEAARAFTARLNLARRAVSLGGTETLVVHAASMIHARLTPEQRAEAGISENLIRVSIGLEAPGDIMADFDQALGG